MYTYNLQNKEGFFSFAAKKCCEAMLHTLKC